MSVIQYVGDGLRNLVANIGTPRDKASHNFYALPLLTPEDALNA